MLKINKSMFLQVVAVLASGCSTKDSAVSADSTTCEQLCQIEYACGGDARDQVRDECERHCEQALAGECAPVFGWLAQCDLAITGHGDVACVAEGIIYQVPGCEHWGDAYEVCEQAGGRQACQSTCGWAAEACSAEDYEQCMLECYSTYGACLRGTAPGYFWFACSSGQESERMTSCTDIGG